ncbi:MAG: PIG-L deacetylase family protein [Dehalococcoidia bacterium]|nr:PIG-L deacetylase family protein [Dehalococcoidia bacterium]
MITLPEPVYCLVVAPHPDDAEFGIAGTAAKWVRAGKPVAYVICTNGDKGTSDPSLNSVKLAEIREVEQLAAAKVLGVRDVVFLRYPDQGIDDTPEFRKDVVKQIRYFRPTVVATCDPYRRYIWHRDHRITGQVTLDAVFPYARDMLAYPDLYEQGYLPHKVKEVLLWGSPDINLREDISETFDLKIAALKCHKSQFDVEELEKRIRERYKTAAGTGYQYAEAFHKEEIWR